MRTVGILGGGQLGGMLASALQDLGAVVWVYDPDPQAPALRRVARAFTRPWSDRAALEEFLLGCETATYEWENVETTGLVGARGLEKLRPSLDVLEVTQDRIREKELFRTAGLPQADSRASRSLDDLLPALRDLGAPAVLKTARGGYDGKGQWPVGSEEDLRRLAGGPEAGPLARGWVLEEKVGLERELSVITAREANGNEVSFPLFENEHRSHVLDVTLVPARVDQRLREEAAEIGRAAAATLGVVGLLTTELFLGTSRRAPGRLLMANELAPRPHNSGHVTRKACTLSQFEALARILLEVPLPEPELAGTGSYCMANLLGDVWGDRPADGLDLSAWSGFPDVLEVVLYGKSEVRPGRKMGHLTARGADAGAALRAAQGLREALRRPA